MVTKEPVYKGPKKNHTAVFVGVPYDKATFNNPYLNRIRFIHSRKATVYCGSSKYRYSPAFPSDLNGFRAGSDGLEIMYSPCWKRQGCTEKQNVEYMKKYDRENGRETVFLGYVKDTE